MLAALAQMAVMNKGLLSAAEDGDQAAAHALSYVQYFGWLGVGIGMTTAFLAMGLGGVRNAVLPPWFAMTTMRLKRAPSHPRILRRATQVPPVPDDSPRSRRGVV